MAQFNPFESINQKLDQIQADVEAIKSKPEPEPLAQERFLTVDEVCEILSISRVSLWNFDKKGITRPVRIGNLKRYRLSDIENFGSEKEKGGRHEKSKTSIDSNSGGNQTT